MSSFSESHGFPLQAYNSTVASRTGADDHIYQPRPLIPYYYQKRTYDTEFGLLRVVAKNHVPIIPFSNIELHTSNRLGDSFTRSGFSMQVHKGLLKPTGQAVALKRFKTYFDEHDAEDAKEKYDQAIADFSFELQILSKSSLQRHRNIVTLLGMTFDDDGSSSKTRISQAVPILVVELAHAQYPDLSLYFNRNSNPDLPDKIPFKTSASFIADIADGISALHKHDLVHADLKPENILLFLDKSSPNGLVAKISDFGFSGMRIYTWQGKRRPLVDGIPRGGTREWNAPECLIKSRTDIPGTFYKHPANQPGRDIYSFGLVTFFIALNGRYPQTIENLDENKLADHMSKIVQSLLSTYYESSSYPDLSFVQKLLHIIRNTLTLQLEERMKSLDDIRESLFDRPSWYQHPEAKVFVLNFDLYPSSVHELRCSGLYDAFWSSPPSFRQRVRDNFKRYMSGDFPIHIDSKVLKELAEEQPDK